MKWSRCCNIREISAFRMSIVQSCKFSDSITPQHQTQFKRSIDTRVDHRVYKLVKAFECDKNYGQPPIGDGRARPPPHWKSPSSHELSHSEITHQNSFDCLVRRRKSYCENPRRKKWFVAQWTHNCTGKFYRKPSRSHPVIHRKIASFECFNTNICKHHPTRHVPWELG
jgi:hypothetical protein